MTHARKEERTQDFGRKASRLRPLAALGHRLGNIIRMNSRGTE